MGTMGALVEYLLAVERPGKGGRLTRYGLVQSLVRSFPPGLALSLRIEPPSDTYCAIYFWHRNNSSMVPGAFRFDIFQAGMMLSAGPVFAPFLDEGKNLWVEVTMAEPILMVIVNTTNVNQFFETIDRFLIVDTKEDLDYIHELVERWGSTQKVEDNLAETNDLLRQVLAQLTRPGISPRTLPGIPIRR